MLSGKPLFPGRDYHHQLTLILDVLGTPTLDEFYAISTRRSRDYIRALPFRKKRPFATLFPNASSLAVDFLTKTLVGVLSIIILRPRIWTCVQTFDPKKRITVEDALAHPYLEAYVPAYFRPIMKWLPDMLFLAWPRWWARCPSPRSSILRIRLYVAGLPIFSWILTWCQQYTRTISAENNWRNSCMKKSCPSNLHPSRRSFHLRHRAC